MPPLTSQQKQQRRRERLNEVARRLGYETWYKLTTAIANGEVVLIRKDTAATAPAGGGNL